MNKIAYLQLKYDRDNRERLANSRETDTPDIPPQIKLEAAQLYLGVCPEVPNAQIIRDKNAGISRQHCFIENRTQFGHTQWFITDSSTNGTFINGRKLENGESAELAPGDEVVFGQFEKSALRYIFQYQTTKPQQRRLDSDQSTAEQNRHRASRKPEDMTMFQLYYQIRCRLPRNKLRIYFEIQCVECKDIAIFPLTFPCSHLICFICWDNEVFQKESKCPKCNEELDSWAIPERNNEAQLLVYRHSNFEIRSLLGVLGAKIDIREQEIYRLARAHASAQADLDFKQIYGLQSQTWTQEQIENFREMFQRMNLDEQKQILIDKGIDEQFITQAENKELDNILEKLTINSQELNLEEKKSVLMKILDS